MNHQAIGFAIAALSVVLITTIAVFIYKFLRGRRDQEAG